MLQPLPHWWPVMDLCHHRQFPQPAECIGDSCTAGPDLEAHTGFPVWRVLAFLIKVRHASAPELEFPDRVEEGGAQK